ncbi:transporter [Flavobacterium sp. H122]|uniref:transporter n=1 Tax=Flavobacterium sp. H122 TaxID=2529860 RepID=UPI0010AA7C9C|nr:transporter [Flavobacterium sp. H122]
MKLLKPLFLLFLLSTNSVIKAQFTDEINSNRPGNSMGAYSVGKTVFQLESGVNYINESHNTSDYDVSGFGLDLTARYGFWKEQFEVSLDLQFQKDKYSTDLFETDRSGLKQTTLGAKYLFYDPYYKKKEEKPNIYSWRANHKFRWKSLIPAISGYVAVNYLMKNDYYTKNLSGFSPKVVLITQNHFTHKWALVTNIIADKIATDGFNYGAIATVTYGINEKWSAMLEGRIIKDDFNDDPTFTTGATYLLKENLQLDFVINKNIENEPSHFSGGLGVSWRFDKRHEDPAIKEGKEVKSDKKSRKDKSKNGVLSEEELEKEAKKAEKRKRKNKSEEIEPSEKPVEEKKKRVDDLETGE